MAVIVPLVGMYKVAGMRDTDNLFLGYIGLIIIHALMNLPIAVLLMKSFFDDVPKDADEAAMIDGATRWQTFRRIVLPMVRGGIAAAAVQIGRASCRERVEGEGGADARREKRRK